MVSVTQTAAQNAGSTPIRRALISVSDKSGVVDLGRRLQALNVELLSTGGTAKLLAENGVIVTEVSDYTGFPELMDGRVKTLHPLVHGGILGRRGIDDAAMQQHSIKPIDLIVVNLYPFEQTVAEPDCTIENAIENIDIGGPTMLRAAAKNYRDITVLVQPQDYAVVLDELESHAAVSADTRFRLACRAFAYTARYDGIITNYLSAIQEGTPNIGLPDVLSLQFEKICAMRYGENPHQQAAFYADAESADSSLVSIVSAELLQGKTLSYNNVADADAALQCVCEFESDACVIVKHANPCGVAIGDDSLAAYDRAYATDPTSAFGGIIAFNRPLDGHTVKTILDRQFVEVLIAPGFDDNARDALAEKPNVRALQTPTIGAPLGATLDFKRVVGGLLVQDRDAALSSVGELKIVTQRQPDDQQLRDLWFAWRVAKYVKSNAIVYAQDGQTIGIGAGQMSRVYSARIAAIKAADEGLRVDGSVLASDAFFPFRDAIDAAAEVDIAAIIQPGGSMRDDEVIAAANEHNIAMAFTAMRHFRH